MNAQELKPMIEAILMASDAPVPIDRLIKLLDDENSELPSREALREIVEALQEDYSGRGVELVEVASGYRFRARADYADRIVRLWEERRRATRAPCWKRSPSSPTASR
jgi:segregation and condensation protein B